MEGKQFHSRVRGILLALAVILVAFVWVLYDLQVNQYEAFAAQSQRKIARTETVPASRGEILDAYGRVLVDNLPSYNVSLSPSFMGDQKNDILLRLIQICRDQGLQWTDTLPVSASAPFVFTLAEGTAGGANNYRKYMNTLDKAAPFQFSATLVEEGSYDKYTADAGALIAFLRETYKVDEALSDRDARALVGVLYELALRTKEVSQVAYVFAQGVDIDFITAVKEQKLTGVDFDATTVRQYHTELAAHILGRVGLMDSEEWKTYGPLGYSFNASVGKDGVEKAFEQYLHGTPGTRVIETNKAGKVVGESWKIDETTGQAQVPSPGGNAMLTLDIKFQGAVEEALKNGIPNLKSQEAEGAAAVVMDMEGAVLALASYPTFDITQYSAEFTALSADPMKPLYNRALLGLYPPGSTFKMVTATGALQEGVITPKTIIQDTGQYTYYGTPPYPKCWKFRQYGSTHGPITVSKAIEVSCNVFFYDIGRRLGIDRLEDYARMFGLGEYTGIELPESKGVVASRTYTEETLGQKWYEGNVLSAAIGQENNQFTPIQLCNYIATLVNGGTHYQAHLLKTVKSSDYTQVLYQQEPVVLDTIDISPENLAAVKQGMLQMAQSSSYFKNLPFQVGAKTGSAQVSGNNESNAVYVCFAPYDDPQIAVAIVVEKGGGGSDLGGIAQEILEYYFSADSTLEGMADENTLIR